MSTISTNSMLRGLKRNLTTSWFAMVCSIWVVSCIIHVFTFVYTASDGAPGSAASGRAQNYVKVVSTRNNTTNKVHVIATELQQLLSHKSRCQTIGKYVRLSKSTYTRRIKIKKSLMCRGLAKQKCLSKSFKLSEFNVRLPQWGR